MQTLPFSPGKQHILMRAMCSPLAPTHTKGHHLLVLNFGLVIREPPLCSGQWGPTLRLLLLWLPSHTYLVGPLFKVWAAPQQSAVDAYNEVCLQRRSHLYPVFHVFSKGDDALPRWSWAIA